MELDEGGAGLAEAAVVFRQLAEAGPLTGREARNRVLPCSDQESTVDECSGPSSEVQ